MIPAPVLKWPGGKWTIAEWIIGNMPRHSCYLEPFFGSGAIFFNKEPSSVETINDLDGHVVNLYRVIREQPEALSAALDLTPWAREEYDFCRLNPECEDAVERARRFCVFMWQAVGVRRLPKGSGWRSRDSRHQSPVPTWRRLPDRIRLAAERLQNAQIENRPALDIIQRHNSPEVLIYADPPYHFDTRSGERLYLHEMEDGDHVALIEALLVHPGPVLLSGYACPLYDEALANWRRVQTTARAQDQTTRVETLWINPVAAHRMAEQTPQLVLLEVGI